MAGKLKATADSKGEGQAQGPSLMQGLKAHQVMAQGASEAGQPGESDQWGLGSSSAPKARGSKGQAP